MGYRKKYWCRYNGSVATSLIEASNGCDHTNVFSVKPLDTKPDPVFTFKPIHLQRKESCGEGAYVEVCSVCDGYDIGDGWTPNPPNFKTYSSCNHPLTHRVPPLSNKALAQVMRALAHVMKQWKWKEVEICRECASFNYPERGWCRV